MDYSVKKCRPIKAGTPPFSPAETEKALGTIPGWKLLNGALARTFKFKDHYGAIAFVNAVAWISHAENHHPEMTVGYNTCRVGYSTHSIGGISENDFICAAKVNALAASVPG